MSVGFIVNIYIFINGQRDTFFFFQIYIWHYFLTFQVAINVPSLLSLRVHQLTCDILTI